MHIVRLGQTAEAEYHPKTADVLPLRSDLTLYSLILQHGSCSPPDQAQANEPLEDIHDEPEPLHSKDADFEDSSSENDEMDGEMTFEFPEQGESSQVPHLLYLSCITFTPGLPKASQTSQQHYEVLTGVGWRISPSAHLSLSVPPREKTQDPVVHLHEAGDHGVPGRAAAQMAGPQEFSPIVVIPLGFPAVGTMK
ncbi:hypothetical protein DHEL01_v203978 [Diaporthe helianthi]|uniref:Uncharacterized protein n=1 Tax=Diaporthe helianthi TaxID=158607 RepID=A0A2P5I579_DIAHE|nr:hypothetical protein DHEL01_v203978 [Diaporthe helianthi]